MLDENWDPSIGSVHGFNECKVRGCPFENQVKITGEYEWGLNL